MTYIKKFKKLKKSDINIAGGKGASLGEMTNANIPIPNGFVVLTNSFEEFLKETKLKDKIDDILSKIDKDKNEDIEKVSKEIRELILKEEIPKDIKEKIISEFDELNAEYVAVRSSATAEDGLNNAWAGQLDSFLNVKKENLNQSVKKCWASLFTPRAIFYRFEKGLDDTKISVAVVVQKMVNSEKSGIAFSVHPVSQNRDEIIIEVGLGLGEAIVSGTITPDSYIVSKSKNEIIEKNINEQTKALYRKKKNKNNDDLNEWIELGEKGKEQVLSESEILDLAEIVKKIENHYGVPQDIEWAFEDGKFYIVQSRPITTLGDGMENKKDYELHFTISEFGILALDMIFNIKTYGEIDYVILYEDDIARAYLSQKGLKESHDMSISLLDDNFVDKLFEDSKKLDKELKDYDLKELTESNLIEEWKRVIALNNKFCETYKLYEQPFQQALEKEILKKLSKDDLIDILSNKSFDKIQNEKTKKYVERLLKMGEIKLKLHEDSENFFETVDLFVEFISKKYELPFEMVMAMRIWEFEKAIQGKLIVSEKELKKRLEGSAFIKENNQFNLYTGEEYKFWKNKVQGIKNGEITGDVAFPGITSGKVRIHLSWSEITKIEEGSVLVTGMTNPQMIPLLKNVSAIVTDEGGITCHAAIVARELKIPCIVGTKNATQILKDGDLIEVNASNGVVRILEKNNKK